MIPGVNLQVLDGSLGVSPASAGDAIAVVGPTSAGPIDTPILFGRTKNLVSTFASGPALEAASSILSAHARPLIFVRTAAGTAGSYGALVDDDFTGTSVPSLDNSTHPDDDYEAYIEFVKGGTIGTAGITYKWSLDGGRTLSPEKALSTASSITIPGSGGVKIDFAAGTVVAQDKLSFRCVAPKWTTNELTAALTALGSSNHGWKCALVVGPCAGVDVTAIQTWADSLPDAKGRYRRVIAQTRLPNEGETEAQYQTAMGTLVASLSAARVSLATGGAKVISPLTQRQYRRPSAWPIAARVVSTARHIDPAQVDLGPLPSTQIRDANNNPDEHDETDSPGLDDLRLSTLRTIEGYEGTYVNNCRLLSTSGSDFEFIQHGLVMDLACETTRRTLTRLLSKPVKVDRKTGFILESAARDIETNVNAALRNAIMKPGAASFVLFVLSRTDNILSTKTVTYDVRIVPLGYPKTFSGTIGFFNPALQTTQVG